MKYKQLTTTQDKDIPYLTSIYRLPEISRYLSIDEDNYWNYVTSTQNVFFYKIYKDDLMVGAVHCEICDGVLYMSIIVFPEYQKRGIASSVLHDIQNGKLPLDFKCIEVSVDESNIASKRLFEKMNFKYSSKDEELINYTYTPQK